MSYILPRLRKEIGTIGGLVYRMNDDLISRKETLETVKRLIRAGLPEEAIYNGIAEISTAFDKEKVLTSLREELKIAEIEKKRCIVENPHQFGSARGYANGVSFVLQIVEKGGIK